MLLLSFPVLIQSQQTWNLKRYTTEDGLAHSQILSLFQDSKGNLWIGTNGEGLNKYNGVEFAKYNQKNGLASNFVFSIAEGKDGKLYFGTNSGLSVFDGVRFINYTEKDGLPHFQVLKVFVDDNGDILLGTSKGLAKMVNKTITPLTENKTLSTANIYCIFKDKAKNYWFGTWGKGLIRYDGKKYYNYTKKDSLQDDNVNSLYQTKDNLVWIGTQQGLNYFNYSTSKIYKQPGGKTINGVVEDEQGNLIIARYSGFVTSFTYKIKNGFVSEWMQNNSYFEQYGTLVRTICKDKEHNIWIGTFSGLIKIPIKRFCGIMYKSDTMPTDINFLLITKKGQIWTGSKERSVCFYSLDSVNRPKKVISFHKKVLYTIAQVTSMLEDKSGNIWIGTYNGISVWNGNEFVNYCTESGIKEKLKTVEVEKERNKKLLLRDPNTKIKRNVIYKMTNFVKPQLTSQAILSMYLDTKGVMWLGTNNGITQVVDTSFLNLNKKYPILKKHSVFYICEDLNHNMWFATDSGAFQLKDNKLSHFGKPQGFVDQDVLSVVCDITGNLWFATKQGVFVYNYKEFNSISEKDGLYSDNVLSLVFDNDGNLFLGGNKGIDKLDAKLFVSLKKVKVEHFGAAEGFPGIECITRSCYKDSLGRIFFGTKDGVTIYDKKTIFYNNIKPVTYISKLYLDGKDIDSVIIANYAKGVDSTTFLPKDLTLPYNKSHITFQFVGTSLCIPEKVKYQYMLEGLNDDWILIKGKNEVEYPTLPDGTYTFKVRACNDDGVWNDTPATFTFTITPPFWKTWWFYTILTIIAVISIVLYIQRRERKLIKEKQVLEEKVKERTAELYQANEEITAQRDDIMDKNEILQQQKEEITQQAAELEKLSIVASETDNAVMIMDGKGNFEWINEGFTKMYGFTLEELKNQLGSNILDNTGNTHLRELIEIGFESREPIIYEALTHTKSGEKLWAQTTISPIFNDANELIKLVAIDSNIQKIKLAEEEIMQQKEEIEAQRDEIGEQKKIVDEKNKDITDSINYAKNIQNAILPTLSLIKKSFPDTFVLFKPRDIVSGDFYWYNENENFSFFAAVDCTGHGVPGAFMSMLGFAFLNEIVNKENISDPAIVLNKLREQIVKSLHQEGRLNDSKDGMDIVLLMLDKKTKLVQFAGANNPLYLIRNSELIEYKGDKMPIAYHLRMDSFTKQDLQLESGDSLYLFSDGFADQFGGPKGKKFMYKKLKEILLETQDHSMEEQKQLLDKAIEEWMNYTNPETGHPYSQIDDILIIGVRV